MVINAEDIFHKLIVQTKMHADCKVSIKNKIKVLFCSEINKNLYKVRDISKILIIQTCIKYINPYNNPYNKI